DINTFNAFSLRSIKREHHRRNETLNLNYEYKLDKWSGDLNGRNITDTINVVEANSLRQRLANIKVSSWTTNLAPAYQALKEPWATFTITTEEHDKATGESASKVTVIRFAPATDSATPQLFFGQVNGDPDVFIIGRSTYFELIKGITSGLLK
ncbi:MAG: hypothetical protein AAF226_15310, partial [Verrucomicrobiota bacterium]